MKRNLFGAIAMAGGMTLLTSVGSFAQDYTPQSAKDALTSCTPSLTAPVGFTGSAAGEATASFNASTAAITSTVLDANAQFTELTAPAADNADSGTVELSQELSTIVSETCQELAGIAAEYATGLAELKAEATAQPEQEQPEVQKPEQEKPEVQKPEQEKTDKPEVQKPEKDQSDTQTAQQGEHEGND